jgi:hypothetical protein
MVAPEFFGVELAYQLGSYVARASVQEYGGFACWVPVQGFQYNDKDVDKPAFCIITVFLDAQRITGLAGHLVQAFAVAASQAVLRLFIAAGTAAAPEKKRDKHQRDIPFKHKPSAKQ